MTDSSPIPGGAIARAVMACVRQVPREQQGPVYLSLYRGGTRVFSAWEVAELWESALPRLIATADVRKANACEFCLAHTAVPVGARNDARLFSHAHRGVLGLEVRWGGRVVRFAPAEMIERNMSFRRALQLAAAQLCGAGDLPGDAEVVLFEAEQVLLFLGPPRRVVGVYRGKVPVTKADVTQGMVQTAAGRMAQWLVENENGNGRIIYKYFPSRGKESSANNMIRQWMATLCLFRWAARTGEGEALAAALRNVDFNLKTSYRQDGRLGIIVCRGSVKLGAVALAALAISASPRRPNLAAVEQSLGATVDHLWSPDGSFRTFLTPRDRNENQNFYPGEALLYWAHRFAESRDPRLLDRFMRSVDFYQSLHRANPNPAFVPWHTQAYYLVWRLTGDARLREAVFAMNDWLVGMQQWETAPFDDMRGRFYDPAHPGYGPPHASSDGVYLEGLADAFRLATEVGDAGRRERYQRTIVRGLRNVLQLQFADAAETYYTPDPARVLGGVRTTVYNNVVRVDNVQHNLTALMKILDAFRPDDYRAAP